ncbi:TetR/AcrR family transcriptional regulator [Planktotalea sp.]|uniref:TetR/AcrR family transcriptional regulator n=1 Tax=Planktotalea sp. TaxID=2029877 RepID=UPI00329A5DED
MPLSAAHKQQTRAKIVEGARILFNTKGFHETSIEDIMLQAGLTRGGFYNHFKNKDELYAEAVACFLNGRGQSWREEAGVGSVDTGPDTVQAMIKSYLSSEHLGDLEGQCPMIALPSDAARAGPPVQSAYEGLLRAMIGLFEGNTPKGPDQRETALILSTLCVGGMVLARSVNDRDLAEEIRSAAFEKALSSIKTDANHSVP